MTVQRNQLWRTRLEAESKLIGGRIARGGKKLEEQVTKHEVLLEKATRTNFKDKQGKENLIKQRGKETRELSFYKTIMIQTKRVYIKERESKGASPPLCTCK